MLILAFYLTAACPVGSAQSPDESALRGLVERFFAAYAREDLAGFMALWSEKSPEYAQRKQTMQKTFADCEKIVVETLTIREVRMEGQTARVRVVVDMSAVEVKTGKPSSLFGRMERTFRYVQEAGEWKVWRYYPTENDLASALLEAKTEEERAALRAAQKELVTKELVAGLLDAGKRELDAGRSAQAMQACEMARQLAKQLGDTAGERDAFHLIGHVYEREGKYAEALEAWGQRLKLAEAAGNKAIMVNALGESGVLHEKQGHYPQALECYQKSLVLSEELGNQRDCAQALRNIGHIHYHQDRYPQAMESYQKALALFEELGDKQARADTLLDIGNACCRQGDYARALEFYQQERTLFEESGDKQGIARAVNNIGVVYFSLGDYEKAKMFHQQARTLSEESGNKQGIADALLNIGDVHAVQSHYGCVKSFL
jgi:tetratricopeptide (TPR) repeat protein